MQLTLDASVRGEIAELKGTAEDAIEELRRSLRMMRDDFELSRGLEEYVRTFKDRTPLLKVKFSKVGATSKLSQETQLTLFRVLQECLTNAARHAHAQNVDVELAFGADHVVLSVKDD